MNKPIKRAFLDPADGQVFYRIGGNGKPLLLLHRSPRSSDEFSTIMPILAEKRWVIAMDLMGYGDSDKPPRTYSIADYAKTAIVLLDELGIKTISILGNHTGAYVAGEVAVAYPERVEKLILCNMDYFSEQEKISLLKYYEDFQIKADPSNLIKRWSYIESYTGSPELSHRCFLDQLKCFGYPPYGPIAVANYFSSLEQRFRLIKCPTLILSGTEDMKEVERLGLAKAENRNFILKVIPQGKRIDIEGGTFCMINQMPEEISKVVVDFLDRMVD